MALSEHELCVRVEGKTIAHELYTELTDFSGSFFVEVKDPGGETLYLPLSPNLNTYYASPLTVRDKEADKLYTAMTVYAPDNSGEEIQKNGWLYNLSGSVPGKYYQLGNVPFVVKDASQPLKVTLQLTGYTETGGGWADKVYTKIGIHIDNNPYMILEYASYGKTGRVNYNNTIIADKLPYTLEAGPHTVGLCIWAYCTSKDHNRCYINSATIGLESDGA